MLGLFKQPWRSFLQLEYLLESILTYGEVITFGILCETDMNYLPLILQEKLLRDVIVFHLLPV
jgi:hypothetical protein